jgi:hypothetical protein
MRQTGSPKKTQGKVARVATSESGMRSEFQTCVSRVADREMLPLLLDKARQFAGEYIDSLEERPVFPGEKSLRAMDHAEMRNGVASKHLTFLRLIPYQS